MFGPYRKSHALGHEANQLEALLDSIQHRDLENITVLCHVTQEDKLGNIMADGRLIGRETDGPHWTQLALKDGAPRGVWFSASLLQGALPDTSPYGQHRLKIPCHSIVQTMFSPRLYLETFYFYESSPKNQVVRLILVDAQEYPKENEWCVKHCLRRMNMLDNNILVLDRKRKLYRCIKNDAVTSPYIWTELLVVGDVDIVAMDTVDEVSPSRREAVPGLVPQASFI